MQGLQGPERSYSGRRLQGLQGPERSYSGRRLQGLQGPERSYSGRRLQGALQWIGSGLCRREAHRTGLVYVVCVCVCVYDVFYFVAFRTYI